MIANEETYVTLSYLANTANVTQEKDVVYSVEVTKPKFDNMTEIRLVDASINRSNTFYTNYSKININGVDKYYGIKRVFNFEGSTEEARQEIPNIAGQVVLLTPSTSQKQIYSFKNGLQYAELTSNALKKNRLLPSHIYSYEYMIDGTMPENSSASNDTNLRFYGANAYYGSIVAATNFPNVANLNDNDLRKIYSSYYFSLSYTMTIGNENGDHVIPVKKQDILVKSSDGIKEFTYETGFNYDDYAPYLSYIDIFEQRISYHEVPDAVTTADIVASLSEDAEKYYAFSKASNSYVVWTSDITEKMPALYVKNTTYVKVTDDLATSDGRAAKYIQRYNYSLYQDKESKCDIDTLFIKKVGSSPTEIFIPANPSIRPNGFTQYYSYSYVNVKDFSEYDYSTELIIGSEVGTEGEVYIKQNYREIDAEEFEDYLSQDLYTYMGDDVIDRIYSTSSDYIYDLDISGNTVYFNESGEVIPLTSTTGTSLTSIYFQSQAEENNWTTKNSKEELVKDKMDELTLRHFNIYGKFNYAGKWKKINLAQYEYNWTNVISAESKVFVKEEGYAKIPKRFVDLSSNVDYYGKLIGKISNEQASANIINGTAVYVDATKYGLLAGNTNTITLPNGIVISKINKFGFIVDSQAEYFERTPIIEQTKDIYLFPSKDYFSTLDEIHKNCETIALPLPFLEYGSGPSNQLSSETQYSKISNSLAKILIDAGNFSKCYVKSGETYSPASAFSEDEEYYVKIEALISDQNNLANLSYQISIAPYDSINAGDITGIKFYSSTIENYMLSAESIDMHAVDEFDKKFLYSKYFYEDSIINNGIHHAKDGSYYSTVSIYDGTRGTISKSLILQPNIFNITEYNYKTEISSLSSVDEYEDLTGVNQNHYEDYYVSWDDDGLMRLSPESESPAYWQSYISLVLDQDTTYDLLTRKTKIVTSIFDGHTFSGLDANGNATYFIQHFNNFSYDPHIIRKNENLFGIIFEDNMTDYQNPKIIDRTRHTMITPNNEAGSQSEYEYDVVELHEVPYYGEDVIHGNDREGEEIYQEHAVIEKTKSNPVPFYLSNEREMKFTGSYVWNSPTHSFKFAQLENGTYEDVDILSTTGYWSREYIEEKVPLAIASYNFYLNKDEISSTTATYMYIPMSYVETTEIIHPKITYDDVTSEQKEVVRFTYIYDGVEYNYDSTFKVQVNDDGTYTGKINEYDITGEGRDGDEHWILVELAKHIDIDYVTCVKEVVHQDAYTSREYFSYKTSIALTNEKLPSLYNIELVPASTHKVKYWNSDAESYALRTVVDSYAHYVYNYKYETIPFQVASYLYAGDDFSISNLAVLSDAVVDMSQSISASLASSNDTLTTVSNALTSASSSLADSMQNSIASISNALSAKADEMINSLNSIASNISGNSSSTQAAASPASTGSTDSTSYVISDSIDSMKSELADKIDYTNSALNDGIASLNDSLSYLDKNYHTYWMKVTYAPDGTIENVERQDETLRRMSISESINDALTFNDVTVTITYNPDGTYDKTYESETLNLAKILKSLTVSKRVPSYEEFMTDLVPKLYAQCEFDKDIVDTETKDENGNIVSKAKHKPNPIDLAKKSIYRADILWKEMKNKGIVEQ